MYSLYNLIKDKPGFKKWQLLNHALIGEMAEEEKAASKLRLLDNIAFEFYKSKEQRQIRKKENRKIKG